LRVKKPDHELLELKDIHGHGILVRLGLAAGPAAAGWTVARRSSRLLQGLLYGGGNNLG
jgi:hypothetical protein